MMSKQNNNISISGYYWTGGNMIRCTSPGYNSNTGSTSSSNCVNWTNGQYANFQGSGCYTCANNRYIVDENSIDWSGICGAGNYISSTHDCMIF